MFHWCYGVVRWLNLTSRVNDLKIKNIRERVFKVPSHTLSVCKPCGVYVFARIINADNLLSVCHVWRTS